MQASTIAWGEAEDHLIKSIEVMMRTALYARLEEYRSTHRKLTFVDWVTRNQRRSTLFSFDRLWSLNLTNVNPEAYMVILGAARHRVIEADLSGGRHGVANIFTGLTINTNPDLLCLERVDDY